MNFGLSVARQGNAPNFGRTVVSWRVEVVQAGGGANAAPGNPVLLAAFQNDPDFTGPITVTAVNGNPNNVGVAITTSMGGSFMALADGSYDWVPSQYNYGPDSIEYTVSDGVISKTAIITFDNRDPSPRTQDTEFTLDKNGTLSVPLSDFSRGLLDNAFNFDDANLAVTAVNGYPAFVGMAVATTQGGSVWVNSDGSFDYTAPTGFVGNDSFNITVGDGTNSGTITVTLHVIDVWAVDSDFTTLKNQSLSQAAAGGLLAFAGDADGDALTVSAVNGVPLSYGSVTVATAQGGSVTVHADGSFLYTPPWNLLGDDSFEATFTDGQSSASATVNLHVVNLIARDADYSAIHDRNLSIPNFANISNLLTYANSGSGSAMSIVAVNDDTGAIGNAVSTAMGGSVVVQTNGNFVYTPPAGFLGDDWFRWTVSDGTTTATAYANIHVIDHAPVVMAPTYFAQAGQTLSVPDMWNPSGLLNWASDPDDDLVWVSAVEDDPANVGAPITSDQGGSVTVQSDGSFVYTPATGFTGDDTFSVTISDGLMSVTMIVTIHVT